MDITPAGLAKNYIPAIPGIITTAILAVVGWSPNAAVQDATTEILRFIARPAFSRPAALLQSQVLLKKDLGVWGRMWIAKYTIPRPELNSEISENGGHGGVFGVTEALMKGIEELGDGSESFDMPKIVDVEGEWTGFRGGISSFAGRPKGSEKTQYDYMMKEVNVGSPVLLYFHGGAFCLLDPSTHRWTTSALAQRTHGRVFSVRYRLSPQSTFPSALLDALVAYLSLLSPPPGAFHSPIPPSQIIVAGDSSGAGLATALLLLLLTLPRCGVTSLQFHGREVPIAPLPGGLAITSPWLDISRSLPSVTRNVQYDIIAPPNPDRSVPHPAFPHDAIWPSSPPRAETYCEAGTVSHPLVSPLAASADDWSGAPPVYMSVGWEGPQDEAEVVLRRLWEAGATVVFDGYKGMPHCFSVLPFSRGGRKAFDNWARFCENAVAGGVQKSNWGTWTDKLGNVREVNLMNLGMKDGEWHGRAEDLTDDVVREKLAEQKKWRVDLEQRLREEWKRKK